MGWGTEDEEVGVEEGYTVLDVVSCGVFTGELEGIVGDVGGDNCCLRQVMSQGDGDGAAARANIHDVQVLAACSSAGCEVKGHFYEEFSLGAGD